MLPVKRNTLVPAIRHSLDRDEFLTPFSNLFDDFFNNSLDVLTDGFFEKGTYPKVDIRDEESQLVIEAEIPGLTKDQISVEIDNGVLQIKGNKKESNEGKTKSYVHRELKHSSFCRSFSVGDNIDTTKLDAKFENGVLEITLPKKKIEPKIDSIQKIPIK